ncbi:MAG: CinA family protein [Promethearchaeota archaeon]
MDLLSRLERLVEELTKKHMRISVAESCTGGYISHMITNISGASKVFERGVICYSNRAKLELLKVKPETLEKYGAVSKEVVEQLATNIKQLSNVEIGIGVSGIAGPTGGTLEKPVGTVFIGFSLEKDTIVKNFYFKATRIEFKKKVLEKILDYLENSLKIS